MIKNLLRIQFLLVLTLIASFITASTKLQAQSLAGSGNKLSFNGISTYINCGTNNRGITQRVTVEAWIRTTSTSYQWIAGKYSNSLVEEKGFHLFTNNGEAFFNGRVSVGVYMSSGPSRTRVNDGRWHHIAGVFNTNAWQIYVDGVLENSAVYSNSTADLTTTSPLAIGEYFVQSENLFSGDIDEIRVWRTALTQDQIRTNMCRKISPVPAELVAYYNFDQSSGTIAVDKGSVPTNGTLSNFNGTPWQLSGAPLGDASTFVYGTDLRTTRLSLAATSGDSGVVRNINSRTDGVQLYVVNQAPTIRPATGASAEVYFGVFSRGSTGTYDFRLRPTGGLSCSGLYSRPANDGNWSALPVASTATSLLSVQQRYRAEYIQAGTATNAPLVAISGDSILCAGGSTQLTAAAAGAQSYRWNTGATTPTIAVTQPGTYTVTATFAAGCTTTRSRQVLQPTLQIGGDELLCAGSNLTLQAVSAPAGATFRWNTGATSAAISVTQPGTYTLTATYPGGCSLTSQRLVVQPTAQITGDSVLCGSGTSINLQATAMPAGATYRWSTGATTPALAVTQPGVYSVVISYPNGCTLTARRTVVQPVVQIAGGNSVCSGSSMQLQATSSLPGTSFRWSTGATTSAITINQSGTYTVTATHPGGCAITMQQIVQPFQPAVKIVGDSLMCPGSPLSLTAQASGATAYRWSTGASTAAINVTQPGTYTVTATFSGGCTATRQLVVGTSAAVPTFALGADTAVCEGTPLLLRAPVGNAYTYLWSDGSTGNTLLARQGGTYTVTVRSGCNTQTASRTLTAQLCVPNIITPNKDGRNDAFVVASYNVGEWSLAIYNRWGKEVYQTEHYLNDWGPSAAPGVYYYMLRRGTTNSAIKGWLEVVR